MFDIRKSDARWMHDWTFGWVREFARQTGLELKDMAAWYKLYIGWVISRHLGPLSISAHLRTRPVFNIHQSRPTFKLGPFSMDNKNKQARPIFWGIFTISFKSDKYFTYFFSKILISRLKYMCIIELQ